MSLYDLPVREHMSLAVRTIGPDTLLPAVEQLLHEAGISGVPIVDDERRPIGVLSRTDLLHAGAVPNVTGTAALRLSLPSRRAADLVHAAPICIDVSESLALAVRRMRDQHVHRVLVVEAGRLVGIVSTWDLLRIVARARVRRPIGTMMSSPVLSVGPEQPTAAVLEQIRAAHVRGIAVVEHGWPIGVFTQEEALAAERFPDASTIESWFSPAVLSMPGSMAAHRAAAQAVATHANHLVIMDLGGVRGIVTPTDFLALGDAA